MKTVEITLFDRDTGENRLTVLAVLKSVGQKEFYASYGVGLSPDAVFVVSGFDYAGQNTVQYGGMSYQVLRSFERDDEMTELVCQRNVIQFDG